MNMNMNAQTKNHRATRRCRDAAVIHTQTVWFYFILVTVATTPSSCFTVITNTLNHNHKSTQRQRQRQLQLPTSFRLRPAASNLPSTTSIIISSSLTSLHASSSSSSSFQQPTDTATIATTTTNRNDNHNHHQQQQLLSIFEATSILKNYETSQQQYIQSDGNQGMGGGLSALHHIQSLDKGTRSNLQQAIQTLVSQAHVEREQQLESSSSQQLGRIMLGICASNAPEALSGLKSWVTTLHLPRGMLHGMDIDGVPIPVEELGAVYVKYSTGGAMTFSEMRKSRRGFDALWRPGDALLEMYDGDFRGVYLNVELRDGEFRQFGLLPTDLFMEEEEEEDEW